MIHAHAPGRCAVVGNPSDIYGGCVLSCSIPARAHCRFGGSALPPDPNIWNAVQARFPTPGLVPDWSTEVPRSSGLSGSTALLAATLAAVLAHRGEAPALETEQQRSDFAELVRDIELNEMGIVCGYQDAYMIVHGGAQKMDFSGKHPIEPGPNGRLTQIPLPDPPFVLVTTGVERLSGSVHGPIRERWLAGDDEVIGKMKTLTDFGHRGAEFLQKGDWAGLAELMNENQAITASLGGSGEAIDRLVADCKDAGALAAKLAGAGMGGTVIALVPENQEQFREQLEVKGYTRFMRPVAGPGLTLEH